MRLRNEPICAAGATGSIAHGEAPAAQRYRIFVGAVPLSLPRLLAGTALAALMTFAWLIFGYGLLDPPEGKGYLSVSVLFSMGAIALIALFMLGGRTVLEMGKHSQACTLAAGAASSAAVAIIEAFAPSSLSDAAVWACNAALALGAIWLVQLCVHILADACDVAEIGLVLHIGLVEAFIFNGLVLFNGDESAYARIALAALPLLAAALLVGAAWFSRKGNSLEDVGFWLVGARDAATIGRFDGTDRPDTAHPTRALARSYRLMMGALFVFSFYIAFVRSCGLDMSQGVSTHSVGASASLGLVAVFAIVMTCVMLIGKPSEPPAREYYIASALGMAFAALVMIVPGQSNIFAVRLIENVSYILLFFSMLYGLLVYLWGHRLPSSRSFGWALAAVACGNAAGWGMQFAIGTTFSASPAAPFILLGATFVVLAYLLFCFSPTSYELLVSSGIRESLGTGAGAPGVEDESDGIVRGDERMPAAAANAAGAERHEPSARDAADGAGASGTSPDRAHASVLTSATTQEGAARRSGTGAPTSAADAACDADGAHGGVPSDAGASASKPAFFQQAVDQIACEHDLSKREAQVLQSLIRGWSDQRIADHLVLSYHTVRSHIRHIYTKTDVHSRDQLLELFNAVLDDIKRR